MKSILSLGILVLMIFTCQAEISQVNNMKDVFDSLQDADKKTLVIFDVDMVLVQPSDPAFQMANIKRYVSVYKKIMKQVPDDKQMVLLSLITISSAPALIDEKLPQWLDQMSVKKIPMMALTANLTGQLGAIPAMEKWRVECLKKLKIDFSQSAPCKAPMVFEQLPSYRGHYCAYLDGVLFVNGRTVTKGDLFLAFIEKCGFIPNKVVFVDDREDNLKSLEAALQQLNPQIEYRGFHYLGAETYPSEDISEEEFEYAWQKLATQAMAL